MGSWFPHIQCVGGLFLSFILERGREHNIIKIHNNVLWDRQYYMEYTPHSVLTTYDLLIF